MNKKIVTISVSVMAIIIIALASILTVVLVIPSSTRTENKLSNDFSGEMQNSEHVVLTMGTAMATSSGGISKTLTATVLPATASNKKVDWSVAWGDTQTGNVTDYITVTPDADGSTTATVTCYKAFTGNIIVTATTRESGYTANCIVTYIGIPTGVSVSGPISPTGDYYMLGVGKTYTFDVAPTNALGSVGSEYQNMTMILSAYGSIKVGHCEYYIKSGTTTWYEETMKTVALDSIMDSFITASYSNGKLTITTKKTIESYYTAVKTMDGGRTKAYDDKYRESVGDCFFSIVVKEEKSGERVQMKIKFDASVVTGIDMNTPEMSF